MCLTGLSDLWHKMTAPLLRPEPAGEIRAGFFMTAKETQMAKKKPGGGKRC